MNNLTKQKYTIAFGAHLKVTRIEKQLTQADLSIKSKISLSHISRIERGSRAPTLDVIYALAKGLRVHPKSLLEFPFEKPEGS